MSWFRNVFDQSRRLTGLSEPEENNRRDEIDQEEEDPENIGFLKVRSDTLQLSENQIIVKFIFANFSLNFIFANFSLNFICTIFLF